MSRGCNKIVDHTFGSLILNKEEKQCSVLKKKEEKYPVLKTGQKQYPEESEEVVECHVEDVGKEDEGERRKEEDARQRREEQEPGRLRDTGAHKNLPPRRTHSSPMLRALWWSWGDWQFLMSVVPV